jgi:predicted metal-binding protein
MTRAIRKIRSELDETQLAEDLRRYESLAVELGASRAKIVPTQDIPVDERVTLKCRIPRCFGYGTGANCPPNTLRPDELRGLLEKYAWSVFFVRDVPAEVIVRDKSTIKARVAAYQALSKIVNELESTAFYDGYYLAFGLSAGSCRHTFCGLEPDCQALQGKKCRFSLRSRPSMEAVGIDVYKMAAAAGWDVYPIGSGAAAADVPEGLTAGIVIVA